MATKQKIICQCCEEATLVPLWHDDVLIGYHCQSYDMADRGPGPGCGELINDKDYKKLLNPTATTTTTKATTNTTSSLSNISSPSSMAQRDAYGRGPTKNYAQRMLEAGIIRSPNMPTNKTNTPNQARSIGQLQQNQQQQPPQGINIGSSSMSVVITDPTKLLTRQTHLVDRRKLYQPKDAAVALRKLEEEMENKKQAVAEHDEKKMKGKKLKFIPLNTSSEEELQRQAEEKLKNRGKPKKVKKRKNKVLKDKKTKMGDDDEFEEGESDNDDNDQEEGDWDSDQSEESSDDEFADDEEMFPETEQDRLDEEADKLNALMGDNDELAKKYADEVFVKNAKITRVDIINHDKPWAGYDNDQYEVYRQPFVAPQMDERFERVLDSHSRFQHQKHGTLGVNWNALHGIQPGATKWQPVKMLPKAEVVEKSEIEIALESYQQQRLEKALARHQIPHDYKPLIIWSPSQETIDSNPHLTLCKVEVPPLVGYRLRPHQREGVQFLAECVLQQRGFNGCGAILADDMGLGKTLQSVALIYTLLTQGFMPNQPICKKIIVCCPTSLVQNWANEFDKWIGKGVLYVVPMVESGDKQKKTLKKFTHGPGQVLVISYDTLRRHMKLLIDAAHDTKPNGSNSSGEFQQQEQSGFESELGDAKSICDLLICDEAHRLKNFQTQTYRSLNELPCKRRILLSGTPMQNELKEFYSMINFANPNLLGSLEQFSRKFQQPIMSGREPDAPRKVKLLGEERAFELSRIVGKFIIRRTNTLLSLHLPPKTIQLVCTNLSPLQQAVYQVITQQKEILDLVSSGGGDDAEYQALFSAMNVVGEVPIDGDGDDDEKPKKGKGKKNDDNKSNGAGGKILPMLNMLRGLCNHPKIVYDQIHRKDEHLRGELEDKILACYPNDFIMDGAHPKYSGKIHALDRLICSVRSTTNDRFVLISNFTETLDLIQQLCEFRGWKFLRVDGSTSVKNRQANVDKLCAKGSDYAIFLLSSKAGGCGLNLVGANRLVLIDPDWNPAVDKQAAGRIWRDGQPKRCFVYRMFSTGTVDEKIFQRQLSKDGLTEIMGGANQDANVPIGELRKLFVYNQNSLSDTHDTLDCRCLKQHPWYPPITYNPIEYESIFPKYGKKLTMNDKLQIVVHTSQDLHYEPGQLIYGEEPDVMANLWTTQQNPFGRINDYDTQLDTSLCAYPYKPPPITDPKQQSKPQQTDLDNVDIDSNVMQTDVPLFYDPSLPLPKIFPIQSSTLNRPSSGNSQKNSQSSQDTQQQPMNTQKWPNLLQKSWAREPDLEYWSHHSSLLTIPDPCFREAISDKSNTNNKPNYDAYGDNAHRVRFDSNYCCNSNMVSMVLSLEVTGKPLVEDPDGRKWRQYSSLTFRHGQPVKAISKERDIESELQALLDQDTDDDTGTAHERKTKRAEREKKIKALRNEIATQAKFDPKSHEYDSEEDPDDYICDENKPKGRLPITLIVNSEEIQQRQLYFQRQLFRITSQRKQYIKAVKDGSVPGRVYNGKNKSKQFNSDSDDDDNDYGTNKNKRQKNNNGKEKQTRGPRSKKNNDDDGGIDLGNSSDEFNSDQDDGNDADAHGNLVGFLGESTDDGEDDSSDDDDDVKSTSKNNKKSSPQKKKVDTKMKDKSTSESSASSSSSSSDNDENININQIQSIRKSPPKSTRSTKKATQPTHPQPTNDIITSPTNNKRNAKSQPKTKKGPIKKTVIIDDDEEDDNDQDNKQDTTTDVYAPVFTNNSHSSSDDEVQLPAATINTKPTKSTKTPPKLKQSKQQSAQMIEENSDDDDVGIDLGVDNNTINNTNQQHMIDNILPASPTKRPRPTRGGKSNTSTTSNESPIISPLSKVPLISPTNNKGKNTKQSTIPTKLQTPIKSKQPQQHDSQQSSTDSSQHKLTPKSKARASLNASHHQLRLLDEEAHDANKSFNDDLFNTTTKYTTESTTESEDEQPGSSFPKQSRLQTATSQHSKTASKSTNNKPITQPKKVDSDSDDDELLFDEED